MKWLLAIGLVIIFITTGSFPYGENAGASDRKTSSLETTLVIRTQATNSGFVENLFQRNRNFEPSLLELEARKLQTLQSNTERIESVVAKLKSRVGKTWYVFSGSTPSGWDCSGLVYWAYGQLGVQLEHSANKQGNSGTKVRTPAIGDIVVFGYKGSKSYYHSSIYIGDGKVIHAGFRKGTSTSIISIDDPSFRHSTATFIRHIESN
jgi:cell wall-associated NlpC family hydrolase